jgi:hypothetical protein
MALLSISMKTAFVVGFEIVGCLLVALCFMRGFLAYVSNLLDLAIYHLHVKNSPESVAATNASEEIAPKVTPKTSSPLKTLLYFTVCLCLGYTIFHLLR